jgi:hypothetical protein
MAGMLQIITYVLCTYMVLKGIEILQIGLASPRPDSKGIVIWGGIVLAVTVIAAICFVQVQDQQAESLSHIAAPEPSP